MDWDFWRMVSRYQQFQYSVLWRFHQQQSAEEAALQGFQIAVHQKIHATAVRYLGVLHLAQKTKGQG